MDDKDLISRIRELVAEEDRLREQGEPALEPGDRERLEAVERDLDQCWDLLRRRRARRDAGGDPDAVQARPEETVETYLQ